MAAGWSAEETRVLISIWGEENVQSQLDMVARNHIILENISAQLEEMGYSRIWEQCRTKIKNLCRGTGR